MFFSEKKRQAEAQIHHTYNKAQEQAGAELGQAQISYTLVLQAWLTLVFMFIESSYFLLLAPCYWLLATSYLLLAI